MSGNGSAMMCPIFTVADAMARRAEPSKIISSSMQSTAPETIEGIPCLGSLCALYMKKTDADGKVVGGSCAFVAAVQVQAQQTQLIAVLADRLTPQDEAPPPVSTPQ